MMRLISALTFCTIAVFSMAGVANAELPQISDARVVQPPPGANVAAAYFTISNTSAETLQITDAKSDVAKKVEVHLSFVENDVAKMEKQAAVTVEAGESLDFKHGSYHIMFMGLNEELNAGNSLDLTLVTTAGDIAVTVPIISIDDAMPMQHGDKHSDMHHMKEKKSATEESQ